MCFKNVMHRHSEDLLRIERQLGKAGSGKRQVIHQQHNFISTVMFYTFLDKLVKVALLMSYAPIHVSFLSISQAYVQQLESSRIRLNQLEQELQRARAQVRKEPHLFLASTQCHKWT